jgi:hypothetical protein
MYHHDDSSTFMPDIMYFIRDEVEEELAKNPIFLVTCVCACSMSNTIVNTALA